MKKQLKANKFIFCIYSYLHCFTANKPRKQKWKDDGYAYALPFKKHNPGNSFQPRFFVFADA